MILDRATQIEMFCKLQVEFLPQGEQRTVFVSTHTEQGGESSFLFFDGSRAWLTVRIHEYPQLFNQVCEDFTQNTDDERMFYSMDLQSNQFTIKSSLGGGGQGRKRRAVLDLQEQQQPSARELIVKAVSGLMEEQMAGLEEIARLERQRTELQSKIATLSQQLLSKVADKEQANMDLMRRFLPILNSKKEKIRELEGKLADMETGESEGVSPPQASKSLSMEEEEEEEEEEPVVTKKLRTTAAVEEKPVKSSRVQEVTFRKTNPPKLEEDEQQLPAGWFRTTSRSRPGQVCYQHADGRRQFNFPGGGNAPKPAATAALVEDKYKTPSPTDGNNKPPLPAVQLSKKSNDGDSFLSEFF